ncbi:hypothetical protein ACS0TY_010787 [Phlomoides rotata]
MSNKRRIGNYKTVKLTEECSMQVNFPKKLTNPSSFTLSCKIGKGEAVRLYVILGKYNSHASFYFHDTWVRIIEAYNYQPLTSGLLYGLS